MSSFSQNQENWISYEKGYEPYIGVMTAEKLEKAFERTEKTFNQALIEEDSKRFLDIMNSLKKYNKFFRLPSIAYVELEREDDNDDDNPIRHSYIIGGRHRVTALLKLLEKSNKDKSHFKVQVEMRKVNDFLDIIELIIADNEGRSMSKAEEIYLRQLQEILPLIQDTNITLAQFINHILNNNAVNKKAKENIISAYIDNQKHNIGFNRIIRLHGSRTYTQLIIKSLLSNLLSRNPQSGRGDGIKLERAIKWCWGGYKQSPITNVINRSNILWRSKNKPNH
ncbi:hypothetical protein [Nostoc sp.]|uniref:hypothetical protein n=1 Tax=Nostoc sp. TaxID=1180 RepID=UPI002FF8D36C